MTKLLVEIEDGAAPTLAAVELQYIDLMLAHTGGNKKRASELLGIDRRTLYRKLALAKEAES